MIYQTTIQKFFKSNGVDYAMAMDVEKDIFLFENWGDACRKHHELLRNADAIGGRKGQTSICEVGYKVDQYIHIDGTRTVVKSIAKELTA